MKFCAIALTLLFPLMSFASSKNLTCYVEVKDATFTKTVKTSNPSISFSDDELGQAMVRKEVASKDGSSYSLVSMKGAPLGLYKLDSTGKTKLVIYLEPSVNLNDIENGISVVCY